MHYLNSSEAMARLLPRARWPRFDTILAFLCGLLCFAFAAKAGFSLSYSVQHNAPAAGYDRYQFFAINDGTGGTGHTVLDVDMELISTLPMTIGLDSHGNADYMGLSAPDMYNSDRSFVSILGSPGSDGGPTTGTFLPIPGANPSNWIGGTTDMEVTMARIVSSSDGFNYGPDATSASNNGQGAMIATAVVPSNDAFLEIIPWGIAGETGPAYGYFLGATNPNSLHPFDPTKQYIMSAMVAAPEPVQLAVAVLPMVLLIRRRRQAGSMLVQLIRNPGGAAHPT